MGLKKEGGIKEASKVVDLSDWKDSYFLYINKEFWRKGEPKEEYSKSHFKHSEFEILV